MNTLLVLALLAADDFSGSFVMSYDEEPIFYARPPAADPIARVTAHAPVRDITVKEPDIEATIRRIYEGGLLRAGVG